MFKTIEGAADCEIRSVFRNYKHNYFYIYNFYIYYYYYYI